MAIDRKQGFGQYIQSLALTCASVHANVLLFMELAVCVAALVDELVDQPVCASVDVRHDQ